MKNTFQKDLKKTFIELIHIDEIYNQEKEIVRYVVNWFKKLHITTKIDSFGNVIAYYPGKGDSIMLCTHLDSPENVPNLDYTIEDSIIRSKGTSILGADPKSGLAVLLQLARFLKEEKKSTRPIEFVFTRGEEAGLQGARNLDYSLLTSKMGIVLDEDGPCTQVVIQAPGFYTLDVEFVGKIVHPRDWREGINALEIASKTIAKLKQGEIIKGVTFNIGIFRSGTARNTTPGTAELKAELRSFDTKKLVEQGEKLRTLFTNLEEKTKLTTVVNGSLEFEGYTLERTHPLFKKLEQIYKEMHLTPNYFSTFGGSDANVFNQKGIKTVAIGSGYYLAHQYTEYANLDDMEKLLNFLSTFVAN